jgi:translation initiation factor 1A
MYQSRIRNSKQRAKQTRNRTIFEPDEDQEYGIVQDMLGNGRLRALCSDAVVRVGRIRGSMRKYAGKVIIERGDLVILAKRDFEDDKVDVVHKYTHEETSKLMRNGMLPQTIVKEMNKSSYGDAGGTSNNDYVVFMDEDGPIDDDGFDLSNI